jgi:hypothetical protein
LIANGKCKAALDQAKENHKTQGTAASEALLVDAYAARIQSLLNQDLGREAKALIDLVCERYPSARTRLEGIAASVAARTGALDDLVRPLNDPLLGPEQREAIEQAIRKEIYDLAALAACQALPPEHSLRQAAAALDRALAAVTSGPVAEDAIRLPEVSRRSPLASWKLLIRAIASFYRGDGEACRKQLDAVETESAPARLVPAIRAMLGEKIALPLRPAATALVSRISADPAALRYALESFDRAFDTGPERAILGAIRTVVRECRQAAPEQFDRLKQHISVRCAVAGLDKDEVTKALGGPCRQDAYFYRLFARGSEQTGDPQDTALACALWDQFRQDAVREGWFPPNGTETATLYLHMADQARRLPMELLRQFERERVRDKASREERYFLLPEELYQRACALDPHTEAFSQWMDWARQNSAVQAQRVAETWHKTLPADLQPVLYLMEGAAQRKAFSTALQWLARAERIDGVHPQVRRARVRLLAGGAIRHIQQKKPHLAEEKLAALAALPQLQQGDRPAFLAALRFVIGTLRGDTAGAGAARAEVERLLESRMTAKLLIFGVATAAKQHSLERLEPPGALMPAERAAIPACLARVVALSQDLNSLGMQVPCTYIDEAAKQLPGIGGSLDASQLRVLADAGLSAQHLDLAYTASAAGLERGGPTEARFLLLRARALPQQQAQRRALCAAAVVQFARRHRDAQLLEEAVELLRGPLQSADLALTPEEAAEVLRKEKAEPKFFARSGRGPDYRAILKEKLCDCPECRRARGEVVEPFEDSGDDMDLDEIFDEMPIPEDMPADVAKMFFEETRRAVNRGESLDSLLGRLFGSGTPRPSRRKGRRK